MITVRRSDTGRYVLVHEPSQTVMVGEVLDDTYARMEEHLREHPELPTTMAPAAAGERSRAPWMIGVGLLALLPFVWLAVLHYSLGRMIDEVRAEPPVPAQTSEVEQLRSEVEQLRQVISRVEDEVGRARPGAASSIEATAQRTTQAADEATADGAAIRKRGRRSKPKDAPALGDEQP